MSALRLGNVSALFSRFGNLKDVLTLVVPKGFGLLASVASSILIVRGLSVEEMGAYTLIFGYYMLMLILADLGINQTVLRYAAKAGGNEEARVRLVNWGVRLKFAALSAFAAFFFALAPMVASLWASESLAGLMRLSLLTSAASSMLAMPIVYFQSKQEFKKVGALIATQSVVTLAPLVALEMVGGWSLVAVVASGAISATTVLAIGLLMMPKAAYWDVAEIKKALIEPRAFFLSPVKREFNSDTETLSPTRYLLLTMPAGLLFALASRVDTWLMGYFLPKSEIGIYGAAQRVALPLMAASESLDSVISPAASALVTRQQTSAFLRSALKTTTGFAFLGVLYALIAPQAIPALFGEAYRGGIWVTSLLCARFVVAMMASPFTWLAYNFDYAKAQWAIRIVQLISMVAINLALFRAWSIFAPAVAWLAYEIIGAASVFFFLFVSHQKTLTR